MPRLHSAKIYFLVLVLLVQSVSVMAQKPPTGGPNPSPPGPNLTPILIGGGVALGGAASLYMLKLRGPKIPVRDYLPTYLLRHNILPTPDALDLMQKLNPRLNRSEVIRARQKLNNPDFPEVPKEQINTSGPNAQTTTTLPADLKQQINLYKSGLKTYRKTKISFKNANKFNFNLDSVNSTLTKIERIITAHETNKAETNAIKSQLVTDLFRALNKTISRTISTKIWGDVDSNFLREILQNLTELILPEVKENQIPEKSGRLYFNNLPEKERKLYASRDSNSVNFAASNLLLPPSNTLLPESSISAAARPDNPTKTNMLQGFAFAIYKLNETGKPIVKGPEVEKQYFIQYALPALRSDPEAYHHLSEPATYATALLPPAKFYFVVKDSNNKVVPLQHPLIDFREAFQNSREERINDLIKVVIYVTK
ncbi:hypothetical protein [Adhaeribacter arboris]|nr:hypothetical protein [Adhaeribacter arboris]